MVLEVVGAAAAVALGMIVVDEQKSRSAMNERFDPTERTETPFPISRTREMASVNAFTKLFPNDETITLRLSTAQDHVANQSSSATTDIEQSLSKTFE
jgi:hypothetical protein